jgi:hypothetical protein
MTQVGKRLSHHDGKMVTQQANDDIKPRPEKVTVLPARSPGGVIGSSMYSYEPHANRHIGCIDSGNMAFHRGGGA